MPATGIALGSNLGERLEHLRRARDLLAAAAAPGSLLQAPVFRTAPVGCPDDSPDFFNTVIELDLAGPPRDLLEFTRSLERQLGRVSHAVRNAPRVIDIDLLYMDGETANFPDLVLPHPRLHLRRFVLEPLAAIRPGLVPPGRSQSVSELLGRLTSDEPPLARVADDW